MPRKKPPAPDPPKPINKQSMGDMWDAILLGNPYPQDSKKWWSYRLFCRVGREWASAVDKYRECRTEATRAIYRETAFHFAARLSGLNELIDRLRFANDQDPMIRKNRHKSTYQKQKESERGNGAS